MNSILTQQWCFSFQASIQALLDSLVFKKRKPKILQYRHKKEAAYNKQPLLPENILT